MSQEDLIPFNKRTEAEQKEITRKGGIASGKARREKRDQGGHRVIVKIKNRDYLRDE